MPNEDPIDTIKQIKLACIIIDKGGNKELYSIASRLQSASIPSKVHWSTKKRTYQLSIRVCDIFKTFEFLKDDRKLFLKCLAAIRKYVNKDLGNILKEWFLIEE
jgi:hypothetical protein